MTARLSRLWASLWGWPVKTGSAWAARESGRLFDWIPVGLGLGIGLYFALDSEPDILLALAVLLSFASFAAIGWRRGPLRLIFLALLVVSAGFAGAEWRTIRVATPQLGWQQWSRQVTGTIAQLTDNADGNSKILLENLTIAGLEAGKTPKRISVTLRGTDQALVPGDIVTLKATLMPPGPPAMPGSFDFARQAYFSGIGGVGFALSPAVKLGSAAAASRPWLQDFNYRLESLRYRISGTFRREIPGPEGGLAAALTTGIRDGIPEESVNHMRNSGLAHLLAIAGLHLSMVTGMVFFLVRAVLAAIPALALRYPIKKWAALVAAVAALGYLLISGASLPTIRAFMMGGLVFAAILLDRNPISMRLLALAAIFILILKPESLLNVSFQMSFAAVMALIAVYERVHMPLAALREGWGRFAAWIIGLFTGIFFICLTTVIATLATAPFSVYHFNQLALYGVLGNMLAVPLTGLWILPWAILAILLMPFHLEWLAIVPLGAGTKLLLLIADWVSGLPHAVALLPGFPPAALAVMAFGGVWLCLWRSPLRYGGIFMMGFGVMMAWNPPRPDILIDDRGKLMAVKGAAGRYIVSNLRSDKYARAIWLKANGQETVEKWPIPAKARKRKGEEIPGPPVRVAGDTTLACTRDRCFYTPWKSQPAGGALTPPRIMLWFGKGDIGDACTEADVIISTEAVRPQCQTPAWVLDRFDSYYYGSQALWIDRLASGGFRLRTASALSEDERRPWTNRRQAPDWLKQSRKRPEFIWPQGSATAPPAKTTAD